jgi:RHS repeat-associated protein
LLKGPHWTALEEKEAKMFPSTLILGAVVAGLAALAAGAGIDIADAFGGRSWWCRLAASTRGRGSMTIRAASVMAVVVLLGAGAAGSTVTGASSAVEPSAGEAPGVSGGRLPDVQRVSAGGTYQTSFEIPVPAAPGAPRLSLAYDSGAGGSLAGVGWDLSVGWPMSIVRDVRFGTPQWTLDANWLWGSTPLVRQNPNDPDCVANGWCRYRVAPDALTDVSIDLTEGSTAPSREVGAAVRLPSGTTLSYEPILYDGSNYPSAPAGAKTSVFAFRLASAVDRNGYRTCFRYAPGPSGGNGRGAVAPLAEIAYGPAPALATTCAQLLADPDRHRIVFDYDSLASRGYFVDWTLRFGAPTSFTKLLTRISVYALGAHVAQDEYLLSHAPAQATATRRPLLQSIGHVVPLDPSRQPPQTQMKIVRTFAYGRRANSYGAPDVVDMGEAGSFPPALAGMVSRPIRRASVLNNPNGLFQAGQDQDTDAAPPTHATTEQWAFEDVNGDRLPDFQWGKETGAGGQQWPTFERGPLDSPVDRRARPAQQEVLINNGIAASQLGMSPPVVVKSRAGTLESDYASVPTMRDEIPTRSHTSWIWGEGRGQTRTGMPVSISAPELANQVARCPRDRNQDPRHWPMYPDGSFDVSPGSVGASLFALDLQQLASTFGAGNPVLTIVKGIHDGYRPMHGVSATVSSWADMTGDGLPEFVATPGWIERFSIDAACPTITDPGELIRESALHTIDAEFAHEPSPATTASGSVDTRWHEGKDVRLPPSGGAVDLGLTPESGPPGLVGLPLSYDTTTSTSDGLSITVPVGSLVSTGISTLLTPGWKWLPIAAAAPGLTIDTFSPRTVGGFALSIPDPSGTAVLQGLGTIAQSGASAASVGSFFLNVFRVNADLTFLSATNHSRTESRGQLLDINADGLPDYLLYNSNDSTKPDGTPVLAPPGTLLAYLNSPQGFRKPVVINTGFDRGAQPPSLDGLDGMINAIRVDTGLLTFPAIGGPPEERCHASAILCADYLGYVGDIQANAKKIVDSQVTKDFLASTGDALGGERAQVGEIETMARYLEAEVIAMSLRGPTPILPVETSAVTTVARMLSEEVGQFEQTIRHIGYSSRINVASQVFSTLAGAPIGSHADGIAAQTRGFVDLNGDGLPDYVNANNADNGCHADEWQVFWGTGTSSVSAGRAFLHQPAATLQPIPSCVSVPAAPEEVVANGYETLPMTVDRVRREPTAVSTDVSSVTDSFVALTDMNADGRPDLVIAGDTWDPDAASQTWHVFVNTGLGFETTPSFDVASPQFDNRDRNVEIADCRTPDPFRIGCVDTPLNVPYPAIRTTRSIANPGSVRDISQTDAAMIDMDGDGVAEIARRVHTVDFTSPSKPRREAMLVWRRADIGGPQDLMIEDRDPVAGSRYLVDYKPASAFQWKNGRPTGDAPESGHYAVAGTAAYLVRSVTTEPLLGRTEGRTRVGYDYKSPFYDMATRTATGFAVRTREPLDPDSGNSIGASVSDSQRSAQRPNGIPGITHDRSFVAGTGAPVREMLTSYAESAPTATGGSGGLQAVFSGPTRTFVTEYPSDLTRGPVFDLGFDGREPFRDRASGRQPLTSAGETLSASAPTGGSATFSNQPPNVLAYASPHPQSSPPATLPEVTIEAWLKPDAASRQEVIAEQPGAYRLLAAVVAGQSRWRLEVAGSAVVTSDEPIASGRWQYLVATVGAHGARIFVDGRVVGSSTASASAGAPAGNLVIGCASSTGGPPSNCYAGQLGELRIYTEEWRTPPRVTDSEVELQLADQTRADFGQPLRLLSRNDMARTDDDVVTENEYASPTASHHVLGLIATEAKRALRPDGQNAGVYLGFTQHTYDNLAPGLASNGNETGVARYDGPAETQQRPSAQQLHVKTRAVYDSYCPGDVVEAIDPAGFSTKTSWDNKTCTFPMEVRNALGHVSRTRYYGVYPLPNTARVSGPYGTFALRGHYGQIAESVGPNGGVTRTTYDEWGRPLAVWSPLDRSDRPKTQYAYDDAGCVRTEFRQIEPVVTEDVDTPCSASSAERLRAPARTTTRIWDDQLRRCRDASQTLKPCSSPDARTFADEQSTGAYAVTYSFDDGQTQTQAVAGRRPAWKVSGIADFDRLGRTIRTYREQYLPATCPAAGIWCDTVHIAGDPLRSNVASVQTRYDTQGRPARIYGSTTARCDADTDVGQPNCDTLPASAQPTDVTRFDYPAPGVTVTTAANGTPTEVERDTRGLTSSYREYARPSPMSTSYSPYSTVTMAHDRLGRLQTTTDQDGNASRNEYDALSRVTASDDPDIGRTTYTYDLRSNLLEQVVASGEKTTHVYDPLSRRTQTDYLTPKVTAGPPACCDLGRGDRPTWKSPEPCYTVDGLDGAPPPGRRGGIPGPPEPKTFRLDCSGPDVRIGLDVVSKGKAAGQLHVDYRVFSPCKSAGPDCDPGTLRFGYADKTAPDGFRPLAQSDLVPRPLGGIREPGAADHATVRLPRELVGKKFTLLIAYTTGGNRKGFVLDLVSIGTQQVVYTPEERVLRTYDSSEPPYYIGAGASAGDVRERPPTLDYTFDVPEFGSNGAGLADRSPTAARMTCTGLPESAPGISGGAVSLPAGAECRSSVAGASSAFTVEFWLRPHDHPAQTELIWEASPFAISMRPDGRIACGPGPQTFSPVSLPTDAWSHVALVYDGSRVRCAVDGVVQDTHPIPGATPPITRLRLAVGTVGTDVDELRLLPSARSADEVLADALRPLSGGPPRGNLLELDFAHPRPAGGEADQSRAGNNASLVGGAVVPGIQGMAFDTRGGGTVRVPDSPTLRLEAALTAELWVKRTPGPQTFGRLIGKWANGNPGWRLELDQSTGRLKWEIAAQQTSGGGTALKDEDFITYEQLPANEWHHVAATYDGQRLRVFIDGLPAHRWCSQTAEEAAAGTVCDTLAPPKPTPCAVETLRLPDAPAKSVIGDAVCVTGTVDNHAPLLIANDGAGAALSGFVDEARLSNYAKKEFEVAASARQASAYTQVLGRQTALRNQLPVSTAIADQVARERDAFDLLGRPVSSTTYIRHQHATGEFQERAAFDSLDRTSLLEYPHGEVVASGFDQDGTETTLVGYGPKLSQLPAQSQTYLESAASTVTGKPADIVYGNGVTSSWTYDDAPIVTTGPVGGFGPDRLATSTVTSATGARLSDRTYRWDAVGNLESTNDMAQAFSASYGYDDLSRLTSTTLVMAGAPTTSTYAYDPLDNLTTKEDATQEYGTRHNSSRCPAVQIALPHALTIRNAPGHPGEPYCYDAAGKLLTSTDSSRNTIRLYQYYARGKIKRLTGGAWETSYAYNGDGTRVWKTETGPDAAPETIPFPFFKEIPTGCEATYTVAGQLIARRLLQHSPNQPGCAPKPNTLSVAWYTTDHLDSTNLLTDRFGKEIPKTRTHYRPYGEFAGPPPQTDKSGARQFTSKQLDANGLYDFDARPYDPVTGRFTQPDLLDQEGGPEAHNRYSYVLNNPLTLVDPTGHDAQLCGKCTHVFRSVLFNGEWVMGGPDPTPTWGLDLREVWTEPELGLEYVKVRIAPEAFDNLSADPKYLLGHWYIVTPQEEFGLGAYGARWGSDVTASQRIEDFIWRTDSNAHYLDLTATAVTNHRGMGVDPETGQLLPGWREERVYGPPGFTAAVNAQATYGQYVGRYVLSGTCQEYCTSVLEKAGAINIPKTTAERFMSPEYNDLLKDLDAVKSEYLEHLPDEWTYMPGY